MISVFGHCSNFIFEICQTVTGKSVIHNSISNNFEFKFLAGFLALSPTVLRGRSMAKVICAKINCQTAAVIKSKLKKKMHLCVMPFFDNFHSFEGVICWKFA